MSSRCSQSFCAISISPRTQPPRRLRLRSNGGHATACRQTLERGSSRRRGASPSIGCDVSVRLPQDSTFSCRRIRSTMPQLDENAIPDDRLEFIFACSHPALALDAQVALTLRALGGLRTEEIARAFLVSPEAMKRRISRAKAKIKEAGIPFAVPPKDMLRDRLAAILAVVYLIFNEGYGGRADLAEEAIRLGRIITSLMPGEAEVAGLLALLFVQHARRNARYRDDESGAAGRSGSLAMGCRDARRRARLLGEGVVEPRSAARMHCRQQSHRCSASRRSTGLRSYGCTAS